MLEWPDHNFGLRGDALAVARAGFERFGVDFEITSGRRTLEDQAAAMAANEAREAGWIAATYAESAIKRTCVMAVAGKVGRGAIYSVLLGVLRTFTDAELSALTLHLSGDAFDVQPLTVRLRAQVVLSARGREIAEWLRDCARAYGGKFLDREGGLLRLHWQARRRN